MKQFLKAVLTKYVQLNKLKKNTEKPFCLKIHPFIIKQLNYKEI